MTKYVVKESNQSKKQNFNQNFTFNTQTLHTHNCLKDMVISNPLRKPSKTNADVF